MPIPAVRFGLMLLIGFLACSAGAAVPNPPRTPIPSVHTAGEFLPTGWVGEWKDGKPLRAFGPAISAGPGITTTSAADIVSRRFLKSESWATAGELELAKASRDANGFWIQYQQMHDGRRVVGGRAYTRVTNQGQIVLFGVDTYDSEFRGISVPGIDEIQAFASAIDGIDHPSSLELRRHELVFLPEAGTGSKTMHLAYEVEFYSTKTHEAWLAHVDAGTARLRSRESLVRHTDLSGTALGDIEPVQPGNPYQRQPFNYVRVALQSVDSTEVAADTTQGGLFFLNHSEGVFVQAGLSGPYAVVSNNSFSDDTASVTWAVGDSVGNFETVFSDGNTRVQDRDAFYWAMVSRDFIQTIEPTFTQLDYPMPIITDLQNQTCNAFWNGLGMVFFPQGNGCANTARLSSVVIHEYAHGITDFQYRPFRPSNAMHEGFSDYFSATLLNDPVIGRGFGGPGTWLRTIDNNLVQPRDLVGESHLDGLIIAGALWDLRQTLGAARADSLWHYACYGFSNTFDDYFLDVLVTDDDDGNIYNGTPNFAAIVDAFRAHGIGDYSIAVAHAPEPDTEDLAKTFNLTASFLSVFDVVTDSIKVHVTIERGSESTTESIVMSSTGGVREYTASIPAQLSGTKVSYYFSAQDVMGTTAEYPASNAPFVFHVGQDTTPPILAHKTVYRVAEDSDVIRVTAMVSDNLDIPMEFVRLLYAFDQSPTDTTEFVHLEGDVYEAQVPFESLTTGQEIHYSLEVSDGAQTPNMTVLPTTGVYTLTVARGLSRDFEADNGGLTKTGEWEWGISSYQDAATGDRLWATNLENTYSSNSTARLSLPSIDLSAWTRGSLEFNHIYDFEDFWDGARVIISKDNGANWEALIPQGGYPAPIISVDGLPGYSGITETWQRARFDLTSFLGESNVEIAFEVLSDVSLEGFGWYLDDIEFVERQLMLPPGGVFARSGEDGQVTLSWNPPELNIDHPKSTFLGYKVYEGDGMSKTLLTPEPVTGRRYVHQGLTNGQTYAYSLESVYEDGPSPALSPGPAVPFVAGYSADKQDLYVDAAIGEDASASIAIENTGTGVLRVNTFLGTASHAIDNIRILYHLDEAPVSPDSSINILKTNAFANSVDREDIEDGSGSVLRMPWQEKLPALLAKIQAKPRSHAVVARSENSIPPPGDYQLLYSDLQDATGGPVDIAEFSAQHDAFNLWIRITSHTAWAETHDFTLAVGFDSDFNLQTGGNNGEYLLIAGQLSLALFGIPVAITDGSLQFVGEPHYVNFSGGTSAAEFGIDVGLLGFPQSIYTAAGVVLNPEEPLTDRAPNVINITWLDPDRGLDVPAGETRDFQVDFKSGFLPKAIYTAKLFLDTNDSDTPLVEIPITFNIGGVPVELVSFDAQSTDRGVQLTWSTIDEERHVGFDVLRNNGESNLVKLSSELVVGEAGEYVFVDQTAEGGRKYEYYLESVSRTGEQERFGPWSIRYEPEFLTRAVLRQSAPNPMRGRGQIRFGLPSDRSVTLLLFDVHGKRVRTLAEGSRMPAGYHELPWDGRDDQGHRVASGIYHVLLMSGRDTQRGRVVLIH